MSMAAYFEDENLTGFSHRMQMQNEEETSHAMRFFDYVHDRGGRATLETLGEPASDFHNPLDVMERTLEHERGVTALINSMYRLAIEESDYAAQVMLKELIDEQMEGEKTVEDIVHHLRLVEGDGTGLLILDARLGGRSAA